VWDAKPPKIRSAQADDALEMRELLDRIERLLNAVEDHRAQLSDAIGRLRE
jgi:hypothetical protein